jgi:hypothetical protein
LAYAVRYRIYAILSSEEFGEAKSGMKERDTIPKPVGLGMQLENHNTNICRTDPNFMRDCSRFFENCPMRCAVITKKHSRRLRQFSKHQRSEQTPEVHSVCDIRNRLKPSQSHSLPAF